MNKAKITGCVVLVLVVWVVPRAAAGKHPVPLEAGVTDAKCLECHIDKTKGKAVHSAIAIGCTSCHGVRVNKDITRIKLVATSSGKLCLTCHADKSATQIKGKIHSPAVRDCVKCHDPHQSNNEKQLVKPITGGKDENLCLNCHKTGMDASPKGSRHAALDMGCGACHVTHKVGDPTKREFRQHLSKDAPALCLECHNAKDASLINAHQNQPFEMTDCLVCHNPHESKSPKLLQAFVHAPFEGGKGSCSTCHRAPKDGKVVLTQASAKELCVTCHSDKAEQIEKAKVQHPGAAGDCTDCHSAHASKSPGLPRPDAVSVCLACHADQGEQGKKAHAHQPAFEQGCATCHEPHGGSNQHLLRASSPNALCLECHGPDAKPEAMKDAHLVTIFGGKVRLPEEYFAKVVRLPVKYGLGHPVDRHPIADWGDKPINCLTCHQPHSSAQPNLLVKDQANNMLFCATCHQTFKR